MGNSVKNPAVVMRPILLAFSSANQRAPSGPLVMPCEKELNVGMGNSVKNPEVVTFPILLPKVDCSVNHSLPSGPLVMRLGWEEGVGT